MVKTPRWLPDVLAAAALLTLAVLVLSAWPLPEPSAARTNEAGFTPALTDRSADARQRPSPQSLARVFGYRPPAARTTDMRPAPPVAPAAPSIKYMGYITDEKGRARYFFKDGRSGQVLTLYLGREDSRGWKLTSVDMRSFTLVYQGATYTIPK